MTTWHVEYAETFQDWEVDHDDVDESIRFVVLDYLGTWISAGPPDHAEYDPYRDTMSCSVPGTPVIVEFLAFTSVDPPTIVVLGIH